MECGLLLRLTVVLSPLDIRMLFRNARRRGANIRSFCLLVASSMVNYFWSDNSILSSCWVASLVSRFLLLTSLFCIILSERKWTVLLLKDLRCKSFFTRFCIDPNEIFSFELRGHLRTDLRGFRGIISITNFLQPWNCYQLRSAALGIFLMSPVLL